MESFSAEYQRITKILPHRYPFLFVDRIQEITAGPDPKSREGRKCVTIKNITSTEPHLVGHFPNKPITPGVILLEAMAQAGAIACALDGDPPMDILIASIREAKFRKPVIPGDQVIIAAEVLKSRGKILVLKSTAKVDGKVAAEMEFIAHISPAEENE